jgi:hypothetical protein
MAGPSTHGGRAPVGQRGSKYGREPSPVLVSHVQKGLLEPGSAELTINFHLKRSAVVEIRVDGSDQTPPFPTRIEVLGGGSEFRKRLPCASTCLSQGLANEASKPLSIRRRDTRS